MLQRVASMNKNEQLQNEGVANGNVERGAGTLFLVNSLCMGGSEKKIVSLCNALAKQGARVHLGYINGPDNLLSWVDDQIPVVALKRKGKFSYAVLRRLCRYMQDNDIASIVAVNLHPLLYAYLTSRMLRTHVECIALVNTSLHRSRRDELFMKLYAPLLRRADQVIFGSKSQERDWLQKYRLKRSRCRTIFNGVDTDAYDHAALASPDLNVSQIRTALGSGRFVIGSVGALRSEKAHADIIRAAGVLKRRGLPVAVLLVGAGPCEPELRGVAEQELLSDAVLFYGEARDVRPLLQAMDVFVLSSVAVETFSNAALEAMSSSRCVVLSDVGGAREMIVHQESGYIYRPGDVEQLANVLQDLHFNPALRERMARAARARVVEQFSFVKMLGEYQRFVVAGRKVSSAYRAAFN